MCRWFIKEVQLAFHLKQKISNLYCLKQTVSFSCAMSLSMFHWGCCFNICYKSLSIDNTFLAACWKSTVSPDLHCLAKACDFLTFPTANKTAPSPVQQCFIKRCFNKNKQKKKGVGVKGFSLSCAFLSEHIRHCCLYQHNKMLYSILLLFCTEQSIRGYYVYFVLWIVLEISAGMNELQKLKTKI